MPNIEIYFDGYCPESYLKGKQVEMRLNEDDFWESVETGLQMTVFSPFATILRWRGKGKFRQSSERASDVLTGLVMTKSQQANENEIFPDKDEIISNKSLLEKYLSEVYSTREEFNDAKSNPCKKQEIYLSNLTKNDFEVLFASYDKLKEAGYNNKFRVSKNFKDLLYAIDKLKLIFPFDWTSWETGKQNIIDSNFDYNTCSLMEISMYITTIFRADRFNEGTIEEMFKSGTLDKIFEALRTKY